MLNAIGNSLAQIGQVITNSEGYNNIVQKLNILIQIQEDIRGQQLDVLKAVNAHAEQQHQSTAQLINNHQASNNFQAPSNFQHQRSHSPQQRLNITNHAGVYVTFPWNGQTYDARILHGTDSQGNTVILVPADSINRAHELGLINKFDNGQKVSLKNIIKDAARSQI